MTEAEIIINGTQLTMAQAMTVRVAMSNLMDNIYPFRPIPEHADHLLAIYRRCGSEVKQIMMKRPGMGER